MEVVVTEEKKKIFRARKTMKISDRQQLESLHTTLSNAPTAVSDTSQPVMNGTHKEDEQKVAGKELNNVSDSNSPSATLPPSPPSQSSPAPLSSPTAANSQSPKAKDDTSPTSPFHSLNIELKKMQEDEKEENDKKGSSKSQTNRTVTPPPSKETSAKDLKVKQEKGRKEVNAHIPFVHSGDAGDFQQIRRVPTSVGFQVASGNCWFFAFLLPVCQETSSSNHKTCWSANTKHSK